MGSMRRWSFVAALAWLLPGLALATKKPAERYFVRVDGAEAAKAVPAGLSEQARVMLGEIVAKRAEFVAALPAGAPDMARNPEGFRRFLQKRKLRAFKVIIKLNEYERELTPAREGKSGQVLRIRVGLSLWGTGMPDDVMALSGDGQGMVGLEVGKKVRPRDEEVATTDSLRSALEAAVEDAVKKLAATPPAKTARK